VLLTLLGLLATGPTAGLAATVPHASRTLTLVAVGGGLVAAFAGLLRRAGRGRPQFWIGMGLLAGGVIAWVA
jgi:hypothetical protein